jgi:hypothetical protein
MNGDDITPERPDAEGLAEPELTIDEEEGARLLANEARHRLRADGFTDSEILAWAETYYATTADGRDEGDVDGLVAFIAAEQAAGRTPSSGT